MSLKDKLVTSFLAFENQTDIDSPIHEIRVEAIKEFEELKSVISTGNSKY